jgi:hypothetical protein
VTQEIVGSRPAALVELIYPSITQILNVQVGLNSDQVYLNIVELTCELIFYFNQKLMPQGTTDHIHIWQFGAKLGFAFIEQTNLTYLQVNGIPCFNNSCFIPKWPLISHLIFCLSSPL